LTPQHLHLEPPSTTIPPPPGQPPPPPPPPLSPSSSASFVAVSTIKMVGPGPAQSKKIYNFFFQKSFQNL